MAKNAPIQQNIRQMSSKDIVATGYSVGSAYFAQARIVSKIYDGMKPVYRRTVMSAYELCPTKFIKSATLAGHVLGHYHPHNINYIGDVISELVKAGVLEGDGEFGAKFLDGTSARAASFRYTEVRLNQSYKAIFDLIAKYVPKIDGELEEKEYSYVPLPLPYVTNRSSFGLSPGMSVQLPAFTMKSMIDAYQNDNPRLLKSTYGLAILDKLNSLDRLWKYGNGSIYYALRVYHANLGGNAGTILEGSAEIFKPELDKLAYWRSQGWLTMNEVGTNGLSSLFFYRNKGVTQITDNDIFNEVLRISQHRSIVVTKTIAPDGVVHPIGLKTWIGETLSNFMGLLNRSKEDKIQNIQYKINLYGEFSKVKECIINHMKDDKFTAEDIAKETGVNLQICKDIDSWSVNRLRKTNPVIEIAKLNEELKLAKAIDNNKILMNFIESVDMHCPELVVNTALISGIESHNENTTENLDEINEDMMDYDENVDDKQDEF